MDKILLDINVNNKSQDCIIDTYMRAVKDEDGKNIYTDPENCIGKVEGAVHEIIVYLKDDKDNKKVLVISITPHSIKKLYQVILDVESKIGEEFIDY